MDSVHCSLSIINMIEFLLLLDDMNTKALEEGGSGDRDRDWSSSSANKLAFNSLERGIHMLPFLWFSVLFCSVSHKEIVVAATAVTTTAETEAATLVTKKYNLITNFAIWLRERACGWYTCSIQQQHRKHFNFSMFLLNYVQHWWFNELQQQRKKMR